MEIKEFSSTTAKKQLMLLADFGRQLTGETDFDKLLSVIATQISKIIGVKRCFIFIKDDKNKEFWSKIARGKGLKHTEIHLPLNGDSIAAFVGRTGNTVNIQNANENTTFSRALDRITGFKTNSVLAIPLINKEGNIIGVFQLSNKKNNKAFDGNDEGLLKLLASLAGTNIEIAALYNEVQLANLETIYRLAITAEYRDQYDTKAHLQHISEICHKLAKDLNFNDGDADIIKNASMLHDIGKVAISDSILLKPGKLTEDEYNRMKMHAIYGGKILESAKSKILKIAYKMSLYHHEKYDGSGYPFALSGVHIPIEARILSVADVFDALCMHRVYKRPWSEQKAYEYIVDHSGSDFDPEVVQAFKRIFDDVKKMYYVKIKK
ncbi:MAG: HD domain-containing protein [Elusimicrobiota bacterium]|jgi:HD-GYP domain-containing protein (c-di-GMP phosphodiesterase class II)|nr:HD domain-containing protein [Elusimicrobiota bacterium]